MLADFCKCSLLQKCKVLRVVHCLTCQQVTKTNFVSSAMQGLTNLTLVRHAATSAVQGLTNPGQQQQSVCFAALVNSKAALALYPSRTVAYACQELIRPEMVFYRQAIAVTVVQARISLDMVS